MDAPPGLAEVGGPAEVVDDELQVGQLLGQSGHHLQLVARGLDGGDKVMAGQQGQVLDHGGLIERRRGVLIALARLPANRTRTLRNAAQSVDERAEAGGRGVAEADDPGDQPALGVLARHPLRRRFRVLGAGV
jgi:hypothetical protein